MTSFTVQFIPSTCQSLGLGHTRFPVPPFTDDFKLSRRLLLIRILLFGDKNVSWLLLRKFQVSVIMKNFWQYMRRVKTFRTLSPHPK